MPKQGFLTPKAISNRIKAKGMQKLRWYCQACQKQCRDENGFKCHTMSEAHQRQLLLVGENPANFIGEYSAKFLNDFLTLLRRQYGTRRVHCNEVYQEYIKDRDHYHMNATKWVTLTGLVLWLGKQGLCKVEPTPKGWFIEYIDRSPDALAKQAAASKKAKMERDDEERTQQMLQNQIERAMTHKKEGDEGPVYTELQRTENEKVAFTLGGSRGHTSSSRGLKMSEGPSIPEVIKEEEEGEGEGEEGDEEEGGESVGDEESGSSSGSHGNRGRSEQPLCTGDSVSAGGSGPTSPLETPSSSRAPEALNPLKALAMVAREKRKEQGSVAKEDNSRKRKLTTLEEIRMKEEQRKEKMNRRENWITEGIVVKVVHQKLGEKYFNKKGVVQEVLQDLFTGIVKMVEIGDKIKIDQAHLETVIPAIGKQVLVVNGAYRGLRAVLESLDTEHFCVSIRIDQGTTRGRLVEGVPYEDVSKLDS